VIFICDACEMQENTAVLSLLGLGTVLSVEDLDGYRNVEAIRKIVKFSHIGTYTLR